MEIFATGDETEAFIVRDLLASGNIEARIYSGKATPYPVNVGTLGEVRVLVRTGERAQAEELLNSFTSESVS